MRCFVAGEIGDEARTFLARRIESLRGTVTGARWVDAHSVHLTLEFLGDITGEEARRVGGALAALEAELPVDAEIGGLGAFPHPGVARVIWAGVSRGGEGLTALALRVREVTAAALPGRRDDKPFVPHLTLGRFRAPCDLGHIALGGGLGETGVGRCTVDRVILFQSTLKPAGAEYRPLHQVVLSGGGGRT